MAHRLRRDDLTDTRRKEGCDRGGGPGETGRVRAWHRLLGLVVALSTCARALWPRGPTWNEATFPATAPPRV